MTIRSLKGLKNLAGKTVFLRVDFNVPLEAGKIKEDYKIRASLETIKFLLAKGARLVIASHLGEPDGKFVEGLSAKPLANRLRAILKKPVKFSSAPIGSKTEKAVSNLKPGEILFLDNLRFNAGELSNNRSFAKELAAGADIYVNDAFAVSHRPQASVSAIKGYLPAYAGLLLEKELRALDRILKPKDPLVVIIGGAKIGTKAPLISKLYGRASQILLGGALANNFFKYQGFQIGRSLFDADSLCYVKKFFHGRKVASKLILPRDVVVKNKQGAFARRLQAVKKEDSILDIGPETITLYAGYIKQAQTIIWNGPLGKFEEESFKHGTLAVARLVASRSSGPAYGLVGGGETIAALKLSKMEEYVDWISTAGGAMLTYLGGGKMPGLEKIVK